jgi:hypothetical protein
VLPSGEPEATAHETSGAGWSPEIPSTEPWPPEPWQPAQSRPSWRYDPSGTPEQQPSQQPSQPSQQSQPSPLNWPDPQLDQPQPPPQPLPQASWPPRDSQPQQQPWAAQEDHTIPAEERPWADQESLPAEERPWASREQHPWGSPPAQQSGEWLSEPLPPRRAVPEEQWIPDDSPRWRGPLLAGLVAALLTAAVVAGFLFWKKQDNSSDGTVADPQPVASSSSSSKSPSKAPEKKPVTTEEPPPDAADAASEAKAVDSLLGDMVESRKKLEVSYECRDKKKDLATFANAIKERENQLNDADDLEVGALEQGDDVKAALKNALSASVAFNKEAVKWLKDENGCGGDAAERLKDEISTVAKAKAKFLDLWKPIASDQGLTSRSADEI